MTWLCVSVLVPASQIPILVTALPWSFIMSAAPVKKTNLHERFHAVAKL